MLHPDTLALLRVLSSGCNGAVLEIGPYLGGSTLAIASGLPHGRTFLSIEMGGAHEHETMPSSDIVQDLHRNVRQHDISDRVSIVVGHSRNDDARGEIAARLGGQKVGLLMIDADGNVGDDLLFYLPFLPSDCTLVFDDYEIHEDGNPKSTLVKQWVSRAEGAGLVRTLGIARWSARFGERL
nr:class I SAM-dependent methyltransferase [Bradyrhizobium brasilense]